MLIFEESCQESCGGLLDKQVEIYFLDGKLFGQMPNSAG